MCRQTSVATHFLYKSVQNLITFCFYVYIHNTNSKLLAVWSQLFCGNDFRNIETFRRQWDKLSHEKKIRLIPRSSFALTISYKSPNTKGV